MSEKLKLTHSGNFSPRDSNLYRFELAELSVVAVLGQEVAQVVERVVELPHPRPLAVVGLAPLLTLLLEAQPLRPRAALLAADGLEPLLRRRRLVREKRVLVRIKLPSVLNGSSG